MQDDEQPLYPAVVSEPGPAPSMDLQEGRLLLGKYLVKRIAGRRGLDLLVEVEHVQLGTTYALKCLVPDACSEASFIDQFLREAQRAARIFGENVASVSDVGRLDGGSPYLVREALRGPDLAQVSRVRGALPVSEAVDYVLHASAGVAEGHALGITHRNLRPTTLVLTRRADGVELVKVLDFAATEPLHAAPLAEGGVSRAGTSVLLQSLPYLAPEQIRDPHDVDERADIYALGAVLFELLSGMAPFQGDNAPALLAAVVADPLPSLRELRPDIDVELEALIARCLSRARAARPQRLADLVSKLRPYASEASASSVERVLHLGARSRSQPVCRVDDAAGNSAPKASTT